MSEFEKIIESKILCAKRDMEVNYFRYTSGKYKKDEYQKKQERLLGEIEAYQDALIQYKYLRSYGS